MKALCSRCLTAAVIAVVHAVAVVAVPTNGDAQEDLTRFVDPRIGTDGHGHVFMGANVPFGFTQLGPTEPNRGWDWCAG